MYDFVVVGGGSAGCVLAARLSEQADAQVLLIEAGPVDKDPYIHMPVGFFKMTGGPLTWGYQAVARHANNREMLYPQGRVLGGGGSINAQVFTRGCPQDYDRWAAEEGCPGWSFEDVRPYFRKSEDNDIFADDYHGVGGPLGASNLISPHPLTKSFVQACQEAGIPYNADFNGAKQDGCGIYQTTTRNGRRCSAAVGYLNPARGRPNLTIKTDCMVTRIVVEGGRATGVSYLRNGEVETAHAGHEVIVAAGAIGSPKLLMLSGIGPASELRGLGIDVVHDAPGVGRNLQDHFDIDIVYELNGPNSLDKYNKRHMMLWAGIQYKLFNSGPVTSNIAEGGAFWYVDDTAPTPDTQFHFLPGAGVEAGVPPVPSGAGCTLNSYYVRPRSRGSVTLRSNDPAAPPLIDPNYISDPYDLKITVGGVKLSRDIMSQGSLARHIKQEHFPGKNVRTDKEYEDYVRQYGRTAYHPIGTCRMGNDEASVVDTDLKVRGIERLRVVDSSVMPSLISSNTNAPSIMIAEKGADLIKGVLSSSETGKQVGAATAARH